MLLFLLLCLYCINAKAEDGYHETIGIPKALRLIGMESSTRVVGGSQVSMATAFPYQAGIIVTLSTGWQSVCGGALISNTRVLTAAHCWYDGQKRATQFTIVLGSLQLFSGGTRIVTKDITVHPSWNPAKNINDLALVRITKVKYTNNIQPISLPSVADAKKNFAGFTAIATGYGKTSDSQHSFPPTTSLHHVNVKIMSNRDCQKSYPITLQGNHLCTNGAGGVGTCDGDSGGPLIVARNNKRILIGIISFGLSDGCEAGLPSVYSRVTDFLPWIQANL